MSTPICSSVQFLWMEQWWKIFICLQGLSISLLTVATCDQLWGQPTVFPDSGCPARFQKLEIHVDDIFKHLKEQDANSRASTPRPAYPQAKVFLAAQQGGPPEVSVQYLSPTLPEQPFGVHVGPGGEYVLAFDRDPDGTAFFDCVKHDGTRVPSPSWAAPSAEAQLFICSMTGYVDKQRIPQKVTDPTQFRAICSEFLAALLSLFSTFQGSIVDLSQICDDLNRISRD